MNRRGFLSLAAVGGVSLSGCISFNNDSSDDGGGDGDGGGGGGDNGGGGGGDLSLGDSETGEGLRVSVTDAFVAESVDTQSNNYPDPDAWSLLYQLEVEHVGENRREFPFPSNSAYRVVGATYNEEQIPYVLTYDDFLISGESYANYNRVYGDEGADEAYNGTSVTGYVLFEIPPDPDLQDAQAHVYWGPDTEQSAVWELG